MLAEAAAAVIVAAAFITILRESMLLEDISRQSRISYVNKRWAPHRGLGLSAGVQSATLGVIGSISAVFSRAGSVLAVERYRRMHRPNDDSRVWTLKELGSAACETLESLGALYSRASDGARTAGRFAKRIYSEVPHAEIALSALGTAAALFALRAATMRYCSATEIPQSLYKRGATLRGVIVAASDSDNVRFCHRSFIQRLAPWAFARRAVLRQETINVRLAGVDAPEMGHFGAPRQPYASEAKAYLAQLTEGRPACVRLHRVDQYARAVATVSVRTGFFRWKNVSLEMARAGYATLYTSAGAEYGGIRAQLDAAEQRARYDLYSKPCSNTADDYVLGCGSNAHHHM